MEKIISRLSGIQKEGLTEREFYFKVIEVLDELKDVELTSENCDKLKSTLLNIGCKRTEDWVAEQKAKGAPDVDTFEFGRIVVGIDHASLREGVNIVSQYLGNRMDAIYGKFAQNPGTIYSLPKEWCDRSKMLYGPAPSMDELLGKIKSLNKESLGERGFYEEVLKCLISTRNMTEMTPDMHRQISEALREIGCQTVEEWKASRESEGKTSDMYTNIKFGVDAADIGTAVSITERFFKSYDDAVELSNTELAGDIPDALNWINNSQEMRQAEISGLWMVQELLKIDKSTMTEREFYQRILEELSRGLNPNLSRDMHKDVKDALEQIGAQRIDDWESEEYQSPEKKVDSLYRKVNGKYSGCLSSGVSYVSAMMCDYGTARANYELYRVDPGRQMIKEWIEASSRIAPIQAIQASILGKMGERKEKQQELDGMVAEEKREARNARKPEDEVK